MAAGPPGFTAFTFCSLGSTARTAFPAAEILGGQGAGQVFLYVSVWFALMLFVRIIYFRSLYFLRCLTEFTFYVTRDGACGLLLCHWSCSSRDVSKIGGFNGEWDGGVSHSPS